MAMIIIVFGGIIFVGILVAGLIWAAGEDGRGIETALDYSQKQQKEKVENLQKILDFIADKEKMTNNDVEKLLGVSNATVERYLDELEKDGKLKQIGKTGQSVYYQKP